MLSVEHLCKRVISPEGELTLLDDVEFSIAAGEAVAVIGASGSGKSTLLGLLAGLDTPSSGRVCCDDVDLFALNEDGRAAWRGRHIGFVFQSFQLLPNLTALDNVMLPLELARNAKARETALEVLGRVGLAHRVNHLPRTLSGGEQQRVALARAFAPQPKLLLADEPTGSLDRRTGALVADTLFELRRERGTTLVLVTHDEQLAQRCDRRFELEAGHLRVLA